MVDRASISTVRSLSFPFGYSLTFPKKILLSQVKNNGGGRIDDPERRKNTPEAEFQGLCNNLRAWVDQNYDTRLLPGRLSFALLKALVQAGEKTAKASFDPRDPCQVAGR